MKKNQIIEVAYICNGKRPECKKNDGYGGGCYYIQTNGRRGPCLNTTDVKYAKHPKLNPKKNPDRFDKFIFEEKDGTKRIKYYERVDRL